MFNNCSFNQPLNNWDVSSVTRMDSMFTESFFDHSLNNWDVSSVTNMDGMFEDSRLSTVNYDSLLNAWSKLSLQHGVDFNADNIQYSENGADARQKIIDTFAWTIQDGGLKQ